MDIFLAVAYNRAYWSNRQDATNDNEIRVLATLMCLELFYLVGINSWQQLYRGASFAYIGHALQTRRHLLADHRIYKYLIEKTGPDMEIYFKTPLEACEEALRINESDPVVLSRVAKVLLNFSKDKQHDKKTIIKMLTRAKSYLDKSLEIEDGRVWFGYATRMLVYQQLGLKSSNETEKKEYLKLALNDGEVLFKNKYTVRNLCSISNIFQTLAKFPNQGKFGHEYVTNPDYLRDAVKYLSYAVDRMGFRNYYVNFNMGQCYYEMCEFRKAIEWMKRALGKRNPNREAEKNSEKSFSHPFKYILHLYRKEAAYGKSYLLSELKAVMSFSFSKYKTIAQELKTMCNDFKPEMEQFLGFMRKNPFKNKNLSMHVLETCQKIFGDTSDIIAALKELKSQDKQEATDDLQQSFSFSENPLPLTSPCDNTDGDKKFTYDFFVSHSKTDVDWVTGVLIPALETASFKFDFQLKGCYEDRDFKPGISIFDNIVSAVKESRNTFLICSPEYFQNRWKQYETEQSLKRKYHSDSIAPM